jgi:hypothetical protein
MVNKAIEGLVCSRFGEEAWQATKQRAEVEVDAFIGNDGYPDEVTYNLVAAASEVTGVAPTDILFAFGEYWVLKVASEEYGELLAAGGHTLREFLIDLPNFHSRIALIFPKLEPPSFRVSDISDDSLRLHYMTHRGGLSEFVRGILSGLGKKFGSAIEVTQEESRADGAEHDVFLIKWTGSP